MKMLDEPNRMLSWFETDAGNLFFQDLSDQKEVLIGRLCVSTDEVERSRLQGDIRTIKWILGMPEEIKSFLRDKREGKVKGK